MSRRCLRLFKGFQAQRLGALALFVKRGGKRGQPRPLRFRHGWTRLARHHLRTLQLTLNGLLQQCDGRLRLRLQRQPAFQLGQRPGPVAAEG